MINECAKRCVDLNCSCPCKDCRLHIDYEDDLNCCLVSIQKTYKDGMTLREVADRFGVSFVRIKQIEDKAIEKLGGTFKM